LLFTEAEHPDDKNTPALIEKEEMIFDISREYDALQQLRQIMFIGAAEDKETFSIARTKITGTGKETVTIPSGLFYCDWIEYSCDLPCGGGPCFLKRSTLIRRLFSGM